MTVRFQTTLATFVCLQQPTVNFQIQQGLEILLTIQPSTRTDHSKTKPGLKNARCHPKKVPTIWKPNPSPIKQLWTIQNPNMLRLRAPAVSTWRLLLATFTSPFYKYKFNKNISWGLNVQQFLIWSSKGDLVYNIQKCCKREYLFFVNKKTSQLQWGSK